MEHLHSAGDVVDERAGRDGRRYGTPNPPSLGVSCVWASSTGRTGLRQGTTQPVHLAAAPRTETSSSASRDPTSRDPRLVFRRREFIIETTYCIYVTYIFVVSYQVQEPYLAADVIIAASTIAVCGVQV